MLDSCDSVRAPVQTITDDFENKTSMLDIPPSLQNTCSDCGFARSLERSLHEFFKLSKRIPADMSLDLKRSTLGIIGCSIRTYHNCRVCVAAFKYKV